MIGALGFLALWAAGRLWHWPAARTAALLALWWAALVLISAPGIGAPGPAAVLGGDFRLWVLLGPAALVVLAYRAGLAALRARARPLAAAAAAETAPGAPGRPDGPLQPQEIERYARHLFLHEIGGSGQQRLKAARVLVVGAGGLGAPVLLYLAASGVGTIGVIDDDVVELSNLQRQVIHATDRLGQPKVLSAVTALAALNPYVAIHPHHRRLEAAGAEALIADYDLVLDGTDNFETRYLVNRLCARAGKPLVAAALGRWEGQLAVWDPARGGPCYECIFPTPPAPGLVPSCAEAGVAAPLPGILGAMMAMEAVKLITGAGEPLRGRLMLHDALDAETRVIAVRRRPGCAACGDLP